MESFVDGLINSVIIPAVLMIIGYSVQRATAIFSAKTGIEVDAIMAAQMHAAIERYVSAAFAKAGYNPALNKPDRALVGSVILGAQDYIETMNPDAVKRFGIDRVTEAIKKHAGQV